MCQFTNINEDPEDMSQRINKCLEGPFIKLMTRNGLSDICGIKSISSGDIGWFVTKNLILLIIHWISLETFSIPYKSRTT